MIFNSLNPPIDSTNPPFSLLCPPKGKKKKTNTERPPYLVPTSTTVWDWLFDTSSAYCPLTRFPPDQVAGYTNAATRERISYAQVRGCTTLLSTALVRMYGLQPGQTVALFSQNTIWYPVAMLGALRVGE